MVSEDQENLEDLDLARKAVGDMIVSLGSIDNSLSVIDKKLLVKPFMQTVASLKPSGRIGTLYEIVLTHAINAEKQSPGGFKSCLDELAHLIKRHQYHDKKITLSDTGHYLRVATIADVNLLIDSIDDELVRSLLHAALDVSGFGGKILLEKSRNSATSIELVDGFTFNINPMFSVTGKFYEPWLCCIDGYVETVGELNSLLESSVNEKRHGFLFVRGASNDVVNTLKVNYDRKTLSIVPVLVPFDMEGLNALVDIAIVSGADVISSTKGQLISSLTNTDGVTVKSIDLSNDTIVIINDKFQSRIKNHISILNQKRSESIDESVAKLFDKRIRSLTSNQVIIKLVNDDRFVVRASLIDGALRSIRQMIEHGVSTSESLDKIIGRLAANRCFNQINSSGFVVRS